MDWMAAFSFWSWSQSDLGAFHLYAAILALATGPLVFMRRKGDLAHKLIGMVYVIAMYVATVSALSLYDLTGGWNFFHYAAIASLLTLTAGFVAILIYGASRARWALDLHLQMMPWPYLGLALAAIAEAATRGAIRFAKDAPDPSEFWRFILLISIAAGVVGFAITGALVRRVRRRWLSEPAAAPQENISVL
ncbi:MAG: hypothetical protein Tsb0010_14000 [Parvularculaceae bacterium]